MNKYTPETLRDGKNIPMGFAEMCDWLDAHADAWQQQVERLEEAAWLLENCEAAFNDEEAYIWWDRRGAFIALAQEKRERYIEQAERIELAAAREWRGIATIEDKQILSDAARRQRENETVALAQDDASPYCQDCGACGEEGCCPPSTCTHGPHCLYGEYYDSLGQEEDK